MVSTAFAELTTGSRLEMFNLRQICWTTGEALGALCGGTAFLLLYRDGLSLLYWLALGACAVIIAMPLIIRHHPRDWSKAPATSHDRSY